MLIIGISTGSYGIMRLSTCPISAVEPIVRNRENVLNRFMQAFTCNGEYFGGSVREKPLSFTTRLSEKEILSRQAQRSLRLYTPPDFDIFNLREIENRRKQFCNNSLLPIIGSSIWDEYLKLVFSCGISTGKGSLVPVIFGNKFTIEGDGKIIQNQGVDNKRFYNECETGEIPYLRATRNTRLIMGEDISAQIRSMNTAIIKKIEGMTGTNVPYLNVDYRLLGSSLESIQKGDYKLSVAEIHADFVDFINDGLLFESNGTLEQGTVRNTIESLLQSIDASTSTILCPPRWIDNQLYRTEISLIQEILNSQGKITKCVEDEGDEGKKLYLNYQPRMNTQGKSIPSNEILTLLNDRWTVKRIIEEVISELQYDFPKITTPHSISISGENLPPRFRKRGAVSFSATEPRKLYEAIRFWQNQIAANGLIEENYFVIKPRDHATKKTRPVTFKDISGFNTLFDYIGRYKEVLVEAVDITQWSELAFQAGAVNEIKTISWVKR